MRKAPSRRCFASPQVTPLDQKIPVQIFGCPWGGRRHCMSQAFTATDLSRQVPRWDILCETDYTIKSLWGDGVNCESNVHAYRSQAGVDPTQTLFCEMLTLPASTFVWQQTENCTRRRQRFAFHALRAAISSGVGKLDHSCTVPPSTTRDAPFTKLAAFDARNTIVAACKQAKTRW